MRPAARRRPRKIVDRTGFNLENSPTFMLKRCFSIAALLAIGRLCAAETNSPAQDWFTRPLSLGECIGLALKQNFAILKGQSDLVEQADEALRLANARAEAGTGTQLDVLSAQTALTDARSTQVQALRDYAVARVRLERASGESAPQTVVQE
jgi:hypothetical protein